MNQDVIASQASTLRTWAEQWARREDPGSSEVAFLLLRTSRVMLGDMSNPEPMGHPRVSAIEAGLPEPETVSEFAGE